MTKDDIERLNRLEWSLNQNIADVKELADTSNRLKKTLYGIEKTLIQLKWFAIGMAALYLLDQLGMTEIINLMR
jgi:hypothetical protein